MVDRSTAILGMLGIYLVYKAPRGVVCKWLLTSRTYSASYVYGYETRMHVRGGDTLSSRHVRIVCPRPYRVNTHFYVSVVHIVRGMFEGCRDLHRLISVVRAVRFMKLWWVWYVARVALKFSHNFPGETTGTSEEKWVKNMDRCSGRTGYIVFIIMPIVRVRQSRKSCSIHNRGKIFFFFFFFFFSPLTSPTHFCSVL
jgi:hypothetical protein